MGIFTVLVLMGSSKSYIQVRIPLILKKGLLLKSEAVEVIQQSHFFM